GGPNKLRKVCGPSGPRACGLLGIGHPNTNRWAPNQVHRQLRRGESRKNWFSANFPCCPCYIGTDATVLFEVMVDWLVDARWAKGSEQEEFSGTRHGSPRAGPWKTPTDRDNRDARLTV